MGRSSVVEADVGETLANAQDESLRRRGAKLGALHHDTHSLGPTQVDLRTAALMRGIERVRAAKRRRGVFP